MPHFLRNIEIYLSLAGLLVIFGATALIAPGGVNAWEVAAITATLVGVLHGVIFWMVRRRQRTLRRAAFHEIQSMLKDIINNQLTVIQTVATPSVNSEMATGRACGYISDSVGRINQALHELSEESLQKWQTQYGRDRRDPAGALTSPSCLPDNSPRPRLPR